MHSHLELVTGEPVQFVNQHIIPSLLVAVFHHLLKGVISNDLQTAIFDYIKQYNSPVLPIQAIMDMFSTELGEIEIHNKYSLHSQLKKFLPKEYSINRDYVMKSSGDTFYSVIEAYVKQSSFPVTKRDIQSNFPGVTEIVIQQIAATTKVINMNGYYVHIDNLKITDEEISSLKHAVDNELSDREIHHASIVFSKIKWELSGLFNRVGVNHYLQFYYLLRKLFPNEYEYNRPFIGALGVEVINGEAQVINLIMRTDECSISDIRQFAKEVGTIIDRYIEFIDRNNDSFIFKNRETVISVNAAGLEEVDFSRLDDVLDEFIGEEQYKLLSDFYNYRELPELTCLWNTCSAIINKDNFIDGIVIDKNINVIPYKFIDVTFLQIENYLRINAKTHFLEMFDSKYLIEINKLRLGEKENIMLPSPITAPFSQGERQVYIMSLYLALLKTSKKDIPFFIDTSLESITVVESNTVYASQDGILYNKAITEIIYVPKGIRTIVIPDSVTNIGDFAFGNCSLLESITIPNRESISYLHPAISC